MAWNIEILVVDPAFDSPAAAVPDVFSSSGRFVDSFDAASSSSLDTDLAGATLHGKTWIVDVLCRLSRRPEDLRELSVGRTVHLCRVAEPEIALTFRDGQAVELEAPEGPQPTYGEDRAWRFLERVTGVKCPHGLHGTYEILQVD